MTIAIIDYGRGNLRSVAGAVERLGYQPIVTADAGEINTADRLILPGVGAFGEGMANLKTRGLLEILNREVNEKKKPFLGICLGFQLIAQESEEFGNYQGLGWIDARIKRLRPSQAEFRVPHVGWDELVQVRESPLFAKVPGDALFYYTHSYCMETEDRSAVIGECDYGYRFVAAVEKENIFATLFHPEKSQIHGLTVLGNFLRSGGPCSESA